MNPTIFSVSQALKGNEYVGTSRFQVTPQTVSTIISLNLRFVCLPQNNNVLKIRYHKVETMPKTLFWGSGVLQSCISRIINPSKTIREKYLNLSKTHEIENLVLIAEDKNKTWRNISVSNVYKFSHTGSAVTMNTYAPSMMYYIPKRLCSSQRT